MNVPLRLIVLFIVLTGIFGFVQKANSQIDINETFTGEVMDPSIIKTDQGELSVISGADPIGKGWLRLTPAELDSRGGFYINN